MKPMLAKKYTNQDPVGWWMSEKYDGVRAIWDGATLMSRTGKVLNAPKWFTNNLPQNVVLDGELWEGRGLFQKTVGKIKAHKGDWSNIKFMVFDAPSKDKFSTRVDLLNCLTLPSYCRVVPHTVCGSVMELIYYESGIHNLGGEGVMLRDPESLYEHKRSSSLLKLKRTLFDDAYVVAHIAGKGKHVGRLGALQCTYNNKVFKIGTGLSDEDRENPPPIGSAVTFSFSELTDGGVPRFPVFIVVRDYE